MFHDIRPSILQCMRELEQIDAADRGDGTPRMQRLRQIPPDTGRFIALLAATAHNVFLPVLFVFVAATLASANSARAETASTVADFQSNKRLAAYIGSRQMQEILFRLGVEQDRKFGLQVDCKSQFDVKPLGVVILSPIDLPDDKQNPTKGAWLFRYHLARCGESKVYNALFAANGEGSAPAYHAYYPGSTNAHPILVKDAMLSAMANAVIRSEVKNCKSADVLDMRVTEPPHTVQNGVKEFKGVWGETWTFKVCDKTVEVPITFTPDIGGGGTSFSMKLQ